MRASVATTAAEAGVSKMSFASQERLVDAAARGRADSVVSGPGGRVKRSTQCSRRRRCRPPGSSSTRRRAKRERAGQFCPGTPWRRSCAARNSRRPARRRAGRRRAVGRHEDPHGFAQKSLVFPGIRPLQHQQPAEVRGAQEHRQEQVRCLKRVPHLQRAGRVGPAQVGSQLGTEALGAVLVERAADFRLRPRDAVDRAQGAQGVVPARQFEEPGPDRQQRLLRLARVQGLDARGAGHHRRRPVVHDRLEQSLLGAEVAVHGHLGHPGVRGDGVHAGALQAMLVEVPLRRFQDAPDALGVAWPPALGLGSGLWGECHGLI